MNRLTKKQYPDATTVNYTVQAGNGLGDIALELKNRINAAAAGYVATVDGERVVIERAAGTFSSGVVVTATPADTRVRATATGNLALVADTVKPFAWTTILAGAPKTGEVWRVTLGGADYDHTVTAGENTADIALDLAAKINAAVTTFAATTEDRTLVIVDFSRSAAAPVTKIDGDATDKRFAASGIDLSAAALAATLVAPGALLPGQTYTVLLRVGDAATQYTYVSVAGDTAANVIRALAAASSAASSSSVAELSSSSSVSSS